MKSFKLLKLMVILGSLFVTSCGSNPEVSSNNTSEETSAPVSSSQPYSYEQTSDAPLIDNGIDFIMGKLIYHVDKDAKKISVMDYDMDFWKKYREQGTLVREINFNFVKYIGYDSIHYTEEGKDYFIYKKETSFTLSKVDGNTTISNTIFRFPLNPAIPERGCFYISEKHTQNNEDFWLFLRLDAEYAALYVGYRTDGYDHELGYINEYKYSYNQIGMMIKIPHMDETSYCTLSVVDQYTIRFNNHSENPNGYPCSGTFTYDGLDSTNLGSNNG